MKVIVAMDSFKGSVSSLKAANAISHGIKEIYKEAEVITLPLADGGEGTVDALVHSTNGQFKKVNVTGPLGTHVDATYGILNNGNTAVIEVAETSGLTLIPKEDRNPLYTTTYGVGEAIIDAIKNGCRDFVIGLGGSATNDAGIGMLQALGFRFLDKHGNEVGYGGISLKDIHKIDTQYANPMLADCKFKLACDVNNYLHGLDGAAYIYSPQKGATKEDIKILDNGLKHFADIVFKQLGKDIHHINGAGAAGGLGAGFVGFLNTELKQGIEIVLITIGIENLIKDTNFIITGEGKLDSQTLMGKGPIGLANLAKQYDIPVIGIAGAVTDNTSDLHQLGITSYFSILYEPMSVEDAMDPEVTYTNLRLTANQLFRLIKSIE